MKVTDKRTCFLSWPISLCAILERNSGTFSVDSSCQVHFIDSTTKKRHFNDLSLTWVFTCWLLSIYTTPWLPISYWDTLFIIIIINILSVLLLARSWITDLLTALCASKFYVNYLICISFLDLASCDTLASKEFVRLIGKSGYVTAKQVALDFYIFWQRKQICKT